LKITVLSTLAMKGVLEETSPEADVRFHSTQALLESIAAGEKADVVILTAEGIAQLKSRDLLAPGGDVMVGSSGVGLAVRAGAPKPDISSVSALERTLLAAASVAHSKSGASGLYFAGLLERRGWAAKLKKRVIVEKGPVGVVVAAGGAEIGVQLLCELAPVPGIDIVGPLPDEVQNLSRFAAAVMKDSSAPKEAEAFLDFLGSPPVQAAMRRNLFSPAPRSRRRPG
jgi:molybdate transport system substrate-binding protein